VNRRVPGILCLTAALALGACAKTATTATSTSPKPTPPTATATGAGGVIDPRNFVRVIDNPYQPFTPGTTLVYKGMKDDKVAVDTFEVTRETKTILGVVCMVIRDTLTLDGVLHERTEDWYVQDVAGNVWYFGESTAELDANGKVTSTEGSWEAGVDGAQPGIVMNARPQLGVDIRQEFYKGHAEDHFKVIDLNASLTVPYGSHTNALKTREWTPLDPGSIDVKYYAAGIGMIADGSEDGSEGIKLVEVRHV